MMRVLRRISTAGMIAAAAVTLWGTAAGAAQAAGGAGESGSAGAPVSYVSDEGHWERFWFHSWDECNELKHGYQLMNYWVDGCYGGLGTYYLDVHLPY